MASVGIFISLKKHEIEKKLGYVVARITRFKRHVRED